MESEVPVQNKIASRLNPDLYSAATLNDAARVESLTNASPATDWMYVFLAGRLAEASDVVNICLRHRTQSTLRREIFEWVCETKNSEPVYERLVESGFIGVDYFLEYHGTLLGCVVTGHLHPNRHALAKYLLEKRADPNKPVEMMMHESIVTCAAAEDDTTMLKLLLDHGGSVHGNGALCSAAAKGRLENARLLLSRGANVNELGIRTIHRDTLAELGTPLHKAVQHGQLAMVDLLLQAGSDTNIQDAQGRTVIELAQQKGMDDAIIAKLWWGGN